MRMFSHSHGPFSFYRLTTQFNEQEMNWQYRTISLPSLAIDREDLLSEIGQDGWELVGLHQGSAFFKRPEAVEPLSAKAASVSVGVSSKMIAEDFLANPVFPKKK